MVIALPIVSVSSQCSSFLVHISSRYELVSFQLHSNWFPSTREFGFLPPGSWMQLLPGGVGWSNIYNSFAWCSMPTRCGGMPSCTESSIRPIRISIIGGDQIVLLFRGIYSNSQPKTATPESQLEKCRSDNPSRNSNSSREELVIKCQNYMPSRHHRSTHPSNFTRIGFLPPGSWFPTPPGRSWKEQGF
jgi:hypothetical protein